MIKEKLQKIFDFIKIKDGENNNNHKRKIENLVVFIVILIITIIMINTIWNSDSKKDSQDEIDTGKILAKVSEDKTIDNNSFQNASSNLEEKLKNILSKIDGVGKVDVLITYSESSKVTAMYNEDNTKNDTEESDTQGGNRKVSQTSTKKEVIYTEENGKKVPVTQSVVNPKIEGAIVTANRSK